MTTFKLEFKTNVRSTANLEGTVEAVGDSEYRFSGSLTARCRLYRIHSGFKNTVRLGHGDSSGALTYVEFFLEDDREATFSVEGKGIRAANGTVDFSVAFNEGLSGQFSSEERTTATVG